MRHSAGYGGCGTGNAPHEKPAGEVEEEAMERESGHVPQAGGATTWHDTVRRAERWEGGPAEFTSGEVPADADAPRSIANPRRTVLVGYPTAPAR
jgi:hypothetical protein